MQNPVKSGIVLISHPGGPEVLVYETIDVPHPGPHQVLIGQKAISVNFLDVMFRNGRFPLPAYPAPIGLEAAGIIQEIGQDVTDFAIGDKVAYYASSGAYAEKRLIDTTEIFKLPGTISFDQAAAVMVKGLTAKMLVSDSYHIKPGEYVLIHAMAGGVGSLLSAWAQSLGAIVIGTVGNASKKQLMLQRGYLHVIDLQSEDLGLRVNEITNGEGVDVVYDSVGKELFEKSIAVIKAGGSFVSYGGASGWPQADSPQLAQQTIHFVQAALNNYPGYKDRKGAALKEVFELVEKGILDVWQPAVYPLTSASKAHEDLELRKTTGSIILKLD